MLKKGSSKVVKKGQVRLFGVSGSGHPGGTHIRP